MNRRHLFERESSSAKKNLGIGLAAAGIGAAITYFLYGTEKGARKREDIKQFAYKMKDRAMETTGELGSMAKDIYKDMASLLKDKYEDIKDMDSEDVKALGDRIREHWEEMRGDIEDTIEKAADNRDQSEK